MRSILMTVGLFVVGGMVGCADLLGIEPWEDKPLGSNSSGGGSVSSSGGKSSGTDSTAEGSTGSGMVDPCRNGVQDAEESGVDCGGGACGACADTRGCRIDSDCSSGYCPESRGYCITENGRDTCGFEFPDNPSCGDCIKNGTETDVDCGGDCLPCRQGKGCNDDGECWSNSCLNGTCKAGLAKTRCYSNSDCAGGVCGVASPEECMFESCCQ